MSMKSFDSNNYESAAKDIEQEKKMVAALKRLSIGNSISSFDPDFPAEEMDLQFAHEMEGGEMPQRGFSHHPGFNRSPPRGRRTSLEVVQASRREESALSEETEPVDEDNDEIFDSSNPLLWVPANAHPEVNPENFKTHLKTTVEDLVERQISRKNTISRRSSLSRSFSNKKSENEDQADEDSVDRSSILSLERNRKSNPSLRDLSNELEKMSKLAGMDANNAVTLARTLSTASLGYTDVEKLAFDELNSSPRSSRSSEELSRSSEALSDLEESPTKSDKTSRKGSQRSTGSSSQQDFSLKRSRRLDYRKNSSGGQATNHSTAHAKGHAQDSLPEVTLMDENIHPSEISPTKTNPRQSKPARNQRNSQILFTYKDPNVQEDPLRAEYKAKNNSPYPSISTSSSIIENSLPSSKYGKHNLTSKRLSHVKSQPYTNENNNAHERHIYSKLSNYRGHPDAKLSRGVEPKHHYNSAPRQQYTPAYSNDFIIEKRRSIQPSKPMTKGHTTQVNATKDLLNSNMYLNSTRDASPYSQTNAAVPNHRNLKNVKSQSKPPKRHSQDEKSKQLNQNLNLLRSEINEFKESLSVIDSKGAKSEEKLDKTDQKAATDQDLSFDLSYQDVSYEDSLGLDKEVLKELHSDSGQTSPRKAGSSTLGQPYNKQRNGQYDQKTELRPAAKVNPQTDLKTGRTKSNSNETIPISSANVTPSMTPTGRANMESAENSGATRNNKGTIIDSFSGRRNYELEKIREQPSTTSLERKPTPIEKTSPDKKTALPPVPVNGLQEPFQLRDEKTMISPTKSDFELRSSPKKSYENMIPPISDNDTDDQSSIESGPTFKDRKKIFGKLSNASAESLNSVDPPSDNGKKLKKKKSWAWMKERSVSLSSADSRNISNVSQGLNSPSRSFSNPELDLSKTSEIKGKSKNNEKENVIAKFFKKKKSQSPSIKLETINQDLKDSGVTVSYDADSKVSKLDKKKSTNFFKKMKSKSNVQEDSDVESKAETKDAVESFAYEAEKGTEKIESFRIFDDQEGDDEDEDEESNSLSRLIPEIDTSSPATSPTKDKQTVVSPKSSPKKEQKRELKGNASGTKQETATSAATTSESKREKRKEKQRAHKSKRAQNRKDEEEEEKAKQEVKEMSRVVAASEPNESQSQFTQQIQEKLKKSIKRTSKANQPIQFTDSAFGFPLPPPSQSTLVMLDYRFPVHVERAIYRLSHLKLANPKRSLREQVLLSNFMYAYLNLVDHTLHLEQQQNSGTLSTASEEQSDLISTPDASQEGSTTNSMEIDSDLNNFGKTKDTLQT